jgi:hypothetical protein
MHFGLGCRWDDVHESVAITDREEAIVHARTAATTAQPCSDHERFGPRVIRPDPAWSAVIVVSAARIWHSRSP